MAREITPHLHGNTLAVLLKPNANITEILGWDSTHEALRIAVAAPASDNKANTALVKFLKKQTGRACTIIRGKTSRKKIVEFS